jgi:hypothetical protein
MTLQQPTVAIAKGKTRKNSYSANFKENQCHRTSPKNKNNSDEILLIINEKETLNLIHN